MRYKVTVQPVGEDAGDVPQKLQDGILCEGYMLIADRGGSMTTAAQKINTIDIADVITDDDDLLSAAKVAVLANALRRKQKEA